MWIISYIKKFLWMLAILVLASVVWSIVVNIFGLFWKEYILRFLVGLLVSIIILFPFIKKNKYSDYDKRKIFIKAKEKTKSKVIIALKSTDFRREVIVFLIFIIPFIIHTLATNSSSVFEFLFVFFFEIIVLGTFYGLLSLLLLIWVYHSWEKE